MAIFWIYLACRCVALFQSTSHAIWNTGISHRVERNTKNPKSRLEDLILTRITHHHASHDGGDAIFDEYPTTVMLMYGIYGIYAVTSMAAVEITIAQYGIYPSSDISSVGQIIALVIAAATVSRAIWLLWMLLRDAKGKTFTWLPFKAGPVAFNGRLPGRLREQHRAIDPNLIALGCLVSHPRNAKDTVLTTTDRDLPHPPNETNKQEGPLQIVVNIHILSLLILTIGVSYNRKWHADHIQYLSFEPTQEFVKQRIEDLRAGPSPFRSKFGSIYMVVSCDIAYDLRYEATLRWKEDITFG